MQYDTWTHTHTTQATQKPQHETQQMQTMHATQHAKTTSTKTNHATANMQLPCTTMPVATHKHYENNNGTLIRRNSSNLLVLSKTMQICQSGFCWDHVSVAVSKRRWQ